MIKDRPYLYIVAYYQNDDRENEPLSFYYERIAADDIDDAYFQGMHTVDPKAMKEGNCKKLENNLVIL